MPGSFNRFCQLSLVFGAKPGFLSGFDFSQTRNKPLESRYVFEINFFYVPLAKITVHSLEITRPHRYASKLVCEALRAGKLEIRNSRMGSETRLFLLRRFLQRR